MSDRLSDKKPDESSLGATRASNSAAVAAAARAAVDQGMQASARAAESGAGVAREQASTISAATNKTATVAREGVAESVQAIGQATGQATERVAREGAQFAQAGAEQITNTMKSTMERAMTTTEELMSFGQGNIEAFVKSSQIWTSGMQDLGRHMAQSAQAQFDGTVSALKAMSSVKSVHEAIELQSSMARTAMEKAVQDGGKLTDASVKLAEQTIAPLTARVTYVSERFGRVAA